MAETKRKGIGKKTRFEVFKRDSFTCQYCGRHAPDVILEVDHIVPISEGGKNSLMNLITSCRDCNRGKGKVRLTNTQELDKQFEEIKALGERREQIKMMAKWREEAELLIQEEVDMVEKATCQKGYHLSDIGRRTARSWIQRFGLNEVLVASEIAMNKHAQGIYDTWGEAYHMIGGICYNRARQREENGKDKNSQF